MWFYLGVFILVGCCCFLIGCVCFFNCFKLAVYFFNFLSPIFFITKRVDHVRLRDKGHYFENGRPGFVSSSDDFSSKPDVNIGYGALTLDTLPFL